MIHRPAQTLLETVLAAGIIVVSVVTSITLIISTSIAGQASQSKIEAANLAREGIEIVRMIRDTNWLARANNLSDCAVAGCTGTHDLVVPFWNDSGSLTDGCDPLGQQNAVTGCFTPSAVRKFYIPFFDATALDWKLTSGSSTLPTPATMLASGTTYQVCYYTPLQILTRCPAGVDLNYQPTRFYRKLEILAFTEVFLDGTSVPYIEVVSTVVWLERSGMQTLEAEERLYDWQ